MGPPDTRPCLSPDWSPPPPPSRERRQRYCSQREPAHWGWSHRKIPVQNSCGYAGPADFQGPYSACRWQSGSGSPDCAGADARHSSPHRRSRRIRPRHSPSSDPSPASRPAPRWKKWCAARRPPVPCRPSFRRPPNMTVRPGLSQTEGPQHFCGYYTPSRPLLQRSMLTKPRSRRYHPFDDTGHIDL